MSIPFYDNIDLNGNEVRNYKIENLTEAPSNPTKGQQYFNTADNKLYYYNGTDWIKSEVDLIDNLTSTSTTSALTANQGKVLKDYIDNQVGTISTALDEINGAS